MVVMMMMMIMLMILCWLPFASYLCLLFATLLHLVSKKELSSLDEDDVDDSGRKVVDESSHFFLLLAHSLSQSVSQSVSLILIQTGIQFKRYML